MSDSNAMFAQHRKQAEAGGHEADSFYTYQNHSLNLPPPRPMEVVVHSYS